MPDTFAVFTDFIGSGEADAIAPWIRNLIAAVVGALLVYCYNRALEGSRFRREEERKQQQRLREAERAALGRVLEWCDDLDRDLRAAAKLSQEFLQSKRSGDDLEKVVHGWPDLNNRLDRLSSVDRAFLHDYFIARAHGLFDFATLHLSDLRALPPTGNGWDPRINALQRKSIRLVSKMQKLRDHVRVCYKQTV